MVGFLIATHGGFARGILDSIELIAGKQERIDTISILHETSIDVFGKELTDKIVELDAISRMAQNAGKEGIQEFFEEFAKVSNTDMIQ